MLILNSHNYFVLHSKKNSEALSIVAGKFARGYIYREEHASLHVEIFLLDEKEEEETFFPPKLNCKRYFNNIFKT